MSNIRYYSLRMRAAEGRAHEEGGKHISGGEKIATLKELQNEALYLLNKAFSHTRGTPDFFQLKIETIEEPLTFIPPLKPSWNEVQSVLEGRKLAKELLLKCGLDEKVIEQGICELEKNDHVRGAIIIDAQTGKRIDQRNDRGIRVSRFDWDKKSYNQWLNEEKVNDNIRMKEAIALASKVCSQKATVAELCWSDDPDYVTGYVASPFLGYQRISLLKEFGDERGGRIIFANVKELDTYLTFLEKSPVLIGWEEKK